MSRRSKGELWINLYIFYEDETVCAHNQLVGVKVVLPSSGMCEYIQLYSCSKCFYIMLWYKYTVEPPKRGHFGNSTFVLSSEVVLFSEVV